MTPGQKAMQVGTSKVTRKNEDTPVRLERVITRALLEAPLRPMPSFTFGYEYRQTKSVLTAFFGILFRSATAFIRTSVKAFYLQRPQNLP